MNTLFNKVLGENEKCVFHFYLKTEGTGFLGGAVVRNPPANAGDMGLSPGPGKSHMLWSS